MVGGRLPSVSKRSSANSRRTTINPDGDGDAAAATKTYDTRDVDRYVKPSRGSSSDVVDDHDERPAADGSAAVDALSTSARLVACRIDSVVIGEIFVLGV